MALLFYKILLGMLALLQVPAASGEDAGTVVPAEAIKQAIEALDAPTFHQREQASLTLLRAGKAAEEELLRVLETGSVEAKARARAALQDILLGITDKTPKAEADSIRGFKQLTVVQQTELLMNGMRAEKYDLVGRLLAISEAERAREALVENVSRDTTQLVALIKAERMAWWFELCQRSRPALRPESIAADALTHQNVLSSLDQQKLLDKVRVLLAQLSDDAERRAVLEELSQSSSFVKIASSDPQLTWYYSLIDTLNDKHSRATTLAALLKSPFGQTAIRGTHAKSILEYAAHLADQDAEICIRLAVVEALARRNPSSSGLDGSVLIDLVSDLRHSDLTAIFDQLTSKSSMQDWLMKPEQLHRVLTWAGDLDADSRDYVICKLVSLAQDNPSLRRQPFESHQIVQKLWELVQLVQDEKSKRDATIHIACSLTFQDSQQKAIAQQAWPVILETVTPRTEAAIRNIVSSLAFQEWVYETQWIRPFIQRCAKMEMEDSTGHAFASPNSILLRNAPANGYFAIKENRDWLLEQLLPALEPAAQNRLLQDICTSSVVSRIWSQPQLLDPFLNTVIDWKDPDVSAVCYSKLIQAVPEKYWPALASHPQQLRHFKNTDLSSRTRASVIEICITSAPYREWLDRENEQDELVALVERQIAEGNSDFQGLYYHPSYVAFLSDMRHLEPWFQFAESQPARAEMCIRKVLYNMSTRLRDTMVVHLDRVQKLVETETQVHVRSSIMSALLMTPQAVERYASQGKLIDLFAQLNLASQSGYYSSGTIPDEMLAAIKKSGGVSQLVKALADLPEPQAQLVLRLLTQPPLLDSLLAKDQHRTLMEIAHSRPMIGRQLLACQPLTRSLIENGYLERLLEFASSVEERDRMIGQLLTYPAVILYYTEQKQLGHLAKTFDTLSPPSLRNRSLQSLLINRVACEAVCKELGVEPAYALAQSIPGENGQAICRANVIIAASTLQRLPKAWLQQLLEDAKALGLVGNTVRSSLLQRELISQFLAEDMLNEVKQVLAASQSLAVTSDQKALLTKFYANPVVLDYLISQQQTDQFYEHLKTLDKREPLATFVGISIASDAGMQLLFGTEGFPLLVKATESLTSEDRIRFWEQLGGQGQLVKVIIQSPNRSPLLRTLAAAPELKQPLEQLLPAVFSHPKLAEAFDEADFLLVTQSLVPQLSDSCRNSISMQLEGNSPAIWKLVEQRKLEELIKMIGMVPDEKQRETRLAHWIIRSGGVIPALLANHQANEALKLLDRANLHALDRSARDFAIRAASGELNDEVEQLEKLTEPLTSDQQWWLVQAHLYLQSPDKAIQVAVDSNDQALQAAVALEMGDWKLATKLLSAGSCSLPGLTLRNDEERTIEQQSLLMLVHLYQNQSAEAQQCLDRMLAIRDQTKDGYARSRCVNGLLLSGQIDAALQYSDKAFPQRSFFLRQYQRNYQPLIAYAASHHFETTEIVKDLEALVEGQETLSTLAAILIAAFNETGRSDDAQRLHQVMLERLRKASTNSSNLFWYASQLFENQQMDLYWSTLKDIDNITLAYRPPSNLQNPSTLQFEYRNGLLYLHLKRSVIPLDPSYRSDIIAALQQVHRYQQAKQVPSELLQEWVQHADENTEPIYRYDSVRFAIGNVCLEQGETEMGYRILQPLAAERASSAEVLARDAWKRKNWTAAATHFGQLSYLAPARLEAAFLSAIAKQRGAKDDQSRAVADTELQAATRALYEPTAMLKLSELLFELDEKTLGLQFAEKALRCSRMDFWDHLQAIKLLVRHSTTAEDQLRWGQQWQLAQSRYNRRVVDQTELLRYSALTYAAQAELAVAAEDWELVEHQLRLHRQCQGNNHEFDAKWVNVLKEHNQAALAEKLFPSL